MRKQQLIDKQELLNKIGMKYCLDCDMQHCRECDVFKIFQTIDREEVHDQAAEQTICETNLAENAATICAVLDADSEGRVWRAESN